MKILPVEAELFHADEQTDGHDETNNYFSQFSKETKNDLLLLQIHMFDTVTELMG